MNNQLASVVITTYNRANLLTRRSIPSVLGQTYNNIECIVVDDCSTDETEAAVKKLAKNNHQIFYFKTPSNGGISATRNLGIKKSRGAFIAFLDDEDEFLPDYVSGVAKTFSSLPANVGAVATDLIVRDENGRENATAPSNIFWKTGMGNGWTIRRPVFFEKNIWFDDNLRTLEDLDFSLRFSETFTYKILHEPLFRYYTSSPKFNFKAPLAEKRYRDYFIRDFEKVFQRHLAFYEKHGVEAAAWFYFFRGTHYCQFGNLKEGRRSFSQSFKIKPSFRVLYYYLASLLGIGLFLTAYGLRSKITKLIASLRK